MLIQDQFSRGSHHTLTLIDTHTNTRTCSDTKSNMPKTDLPNFFKHILLIQDLLKQIRSLFPDKSEHSAFFQQGSRPIQVQNQQQNV